MSAKLHIYSKTMTSKVVQLLSHVQLFVIPWLQHTRLPCPSLSIRVCSNSSPWSWWYHSTNSSSATLFFYLQSFPASGSFPMSWLFPSDGQSTGASASVLPMYSGLISLGLTGLISLQSKGPSSVFSNTTVQKHQLFGVQPSLWSLHGSQPCPGEGA